MQEENEIRDRLANEMIETSNQFKDIELTKSKNNPALEKLIESEARLRRLIDTLPVCISYVDANLHYRLNNKTYEDWFGISRDDLIGKHIKDILGEETFAANRQHYEAILSGETVTFENTIPLEDGKVRHVVGTHVPDLGVNGEVRGFFALITDITDRVNVENSIRDSEERFHKIFNNSNDAIYLIDIENDKIVDANPKACQMLGYSREEFLSLSISAIHPREMPELITFSEVVSEQGYGWTDELTCRTKSGFTLPAEISASMVDIEDRSCMIAMVRDTTERKKAEERIRGEAARADALARAAARLNTHLKVTGVAKAVCEEILRALKPSAVMVLLYDEGQKTFTPVASLGLPDKYLNRFMPVARSVYERFAQSPHKLIFLPDVQTEPDLPNAELNAKYDVRTVLAAGLIREDQLVGAISLYSIGILREFDVNELSLLNGLADLATQAIDNAQLRQKAEQAAIAEERGRLARELHDSITQSLYSLTLLAEGWRRQVKAGKLSDIEEPLGELGEISQQALKEMRLLVYELRPPELEQIGLIGALQQRLSTVEKRAGIDANFFVDDLIELPPSVEDDLYRITQEALNNAIKHAEATSVNVRLSTDRNCLILEITDNGKGFDPDTASELGGMGLASLHDRVEKLGGSLQISSERNRGTSVKVKVDKELLSDE